MFNAPIPGQSLTTQPKSRPWEKPPKTTNIDKAMATVLQSVTQKSAAKGLLNYMELGFPIESLSQTLLMTYVMKGEFTVDVAMLLMEPTCMLLAKMAKQVGIEPVFSSAKPSVSPGAKQLARFTDRKKMQYISNTGAPPEEAEDVTGLMALGGQ